MLRYKVVCIEQYKRWYTVRDMEKEVDIATCYKKSDADSICRAMNFYNDWVLIDGWDEERVIDQLNHRCE